MVVFKNANYENFLIETRNKRVICYGAGEMLRKFLQNNHTHITLLNKIDYILDRDSAKSGSTVNIGIRGVTVVTIDEIIALNIDFANYVFIMCLSDQYLLGALKTLDGIDAFDGISCYCGISAISWGGEHFVPMCRGGTDLPLCSSDYSIPKVIHYIWFGEQKFGKIERECMESWKKVCPDYEFRFWNEGNYDISDKPLYVRQAYEAKKYAFVSDYARLDIVYNYGGVYLDTDVELLRNIDHLLNYRAFFAFESSNLINTGLGFASIAFNPILLDLLNIYCNILFCRDGELNLTSCPEYHTEFFRESGVCINNNMQIFDDMLFLPSDYLCPLNQRTALYEFTENTLADHRFTVSWFESGQKSEWVNVLKQSEAINFRLKEDWKRSVLHNG